MHISMHVCTNLITIISVKHQPNTSFIRLCKQLLLPHTTRKGGEKKERGSGPSVASHYYGNIAHTARHCIDAGCHGYAVTVLAKELLHKQQSGIRRRQLTLCEHHQHFVNVLALYEEVGHKMWPFE